MERWEIYNTITICSFQNAAVVASGNSSYWCQLWSLMMQVFHQTSGYIRRCRVVICRNVRMTWELISHVKTQYIQSCLLQPSCYSSHVLCTTAHNRKSTGFSEAWCGMAWHDKLFNSNGVWYKQLIFKRFIMHIYIGKTGQFSNSHILKGLEKHLITTLRQKPALLGTASRFCTTTEC